MLASNKKINLSLVLLMAMALAACDVSKPKSQPQEMSPSANDRIAGTFYIDSLMGISKITSTENDFGFPNVKTYTFQACLKDVQKNEPILENSFKIFAESKEVSLKQDTKGCLNWNEEFAYEYLSDSQYVILKRKLVGYNRHRGELNFELAINPWNHGQITPEFIDTYVQKPSKVLNTDKPAQTMNTLNRANSANRLIVNDMRITIQEVKLDAKTGGEFRLELRLDPQIELLDINNQPQYHQLTKGTFKIEANLISVVYENGALQKRVLNTNKLLNQAKVDGRTVYFTTNMQVPLVPTRGTLEIAMQIKPIDAKNRLQSLEAIYIVNEFSGFKGNYFGRIKAAHSNSNAEFVMNKYLDSSPSVATAKQGQNLGQLRAAKYEVRPLEVTFTRIGQEDAINREVVFRVRACVFNGIDDAPMRNHKFEITQISGGKIERITEYDGCLYWDDSITHKYYSRQSFMRRSVTLKNSDLGMNDKFDLILNPWNIAASRDARQMEASELRAQVTQQKPAPLMNLDHLRFNTIKHQYQVDNYYNLTFIKNLTLSMEPTVLIYNNLQTGLATTERLRDGVYLLKVALQRNGFESAQDQYKYISSDIKLVPVVQGRITVPVSFRIQDLRVLNSRNNLLLELAPVQKNKVKLDKNGNLVAANSKDSFDQLIDRSSDLVPQSFASTVIFTMDDDVRLAATNNLNNFAGSFVGSNEAAGSNNALSLNQSHMSVSELLAKGTREVAISAQQMATQAKIDNFLKENNFTYYNIRNESQTLELRHSLSDSSYYLKHVNSSSNLLKRTPQPPLSTNELVGMVQTGKVSTQMARRLCGFWFQDLSRRILHQYSANIASSYFNQMHSMCVSEVAKNPAKFFATEKRLHSGQVVKTEYLQGKTSNITVGTSFNLSNSRTESFNRGWVGNVGGGIELPFLKLFAIGASGGYTVSKMTSDAMAASNGVSIGDGATLTLRQTDLKLSVTNYYSCLAIKINPMLYSGDNPRMARALSRAIPQALRIEALTQGVYLCDTQAVEQPKVITESYFLVTQDFLGGGNHDASDIRNRPFLFSFRGANSLASFKHVLEAQTKAPQSSAKIDANSAAFSILGQSLLVAPDLPGSYVLQ